MNTPSDPTARPMAFRLTPAEHAALMDRARARALQARREAADAFWIALGAALTAAGRAVAQRLALLRPRRAPLRPLEA